MTLNAPVLALLALVLIGTGDARSVDNSYQCVAGSFTGEIDTGGKKLKSETQFNVQDEIVVGTYSFQYEGELVQGTLSSTDLSRVHSINFRWHDKFGTGTLIAVFNNGCTEFLGEWSMEGKNKTHSWDGKRKQE